MLLTTWYEGCLSLLRADTDSGVGNCSVVAILDVAGDEQECEMRMLPRRVDRHVHTYSQTLADVLELGQSLAPRTGCRLLPLRPIEESGGGDRIVPRPLFSSVPALPPPT